ncbi:MAG TPA: thiamine pyrophosphate-binding protein [Devosia sp.]|nr:thiamine pyrophosphate-binding protein [Devosia sp.]
MKTKEIYEELADLFVAEGVTTQFSLLGDANMHWATAMQTLKDVESIHVRHEHCAVTAAMGYFSATGKVGVASVTHGPGFTQVMTALTTAARGNVPLVLFTGEVSLSEKWNQQTIDQQGLATICGAHYISAHFPDRLHQAVRDAFYVARYERKPVVLGVPYDFQRLPAPDLGAYTPSSEVIPTYVPVPPHPDQIEQMASLLGKARCPIFIGGRGALWAGAVSAIEKLADRSGALLSNTLAARGMFDHNPFSLGVSGGFARELTAEVMAGADLVIAFGASLSYHTLSGGKMFPRATVVQVSLEPTGLHHGLKTADIHVRADTKLTVDALAAAYERRGEKISAIRSDALARRIKETPADSEVFQLEPNTVDPREAFAELEKVIPKDYDVVSGAGHQAYFHAPMRGYDPAKYHLMRYFSAIGNALGFTLGVATARGNGRVVLFDGDGGLIMHIQELETMQRHGIKALLVCANDGAYGAELHKLRHDRVAAYTATFGRPDFAAIARGFGLRGATITSVDQIAPLLQQYEEGETAMVWDMHISDTVVSPGAREGLKHRKAPRIE